jgi:spore maturation protein A
MKVIFFWPGTYYYKKGSDNMINYIWFLLMISGIIIGVITGRGSIVSTSIVSSASDTVNLIISLVGILSLWCGVMRIAKEAGLTDKLSKMLKPILKIVFKETYKNNEVMEPMVLNLTSNMMGLSNAATPFGIKTMIEMEKINKVKGRATNDMAKFLVLNAACIQIIPTSVLSIRAASGSENPGIIILPAILATGIAAILGIVYCSILEKFF